MMDWARELAFWPANKSEKPMPAVEGLVKDAGAAAKAPSRKPSAATVSAIVSADEDGNVPLYAPRRKIYPQSVSGTFRCIKWALLIVGCAVYYLLPFVRWDRGPNAPTQ